jgi:hypothetical protein
MNFSIEIKEYVQHSKSDRPNISTQRFNTNEELQESCLRNIGKLRRFKSDYHIVLKNGEEVTDTFKSENFDKRNSKNPYK